MAAPLHPTAATYEQALAALATEREDIVVLTAESRDHVRGLPEALGPRLVDVGASRETMPGAAAGLARRGRTPVVHALASFLARRALEFMGTDLGIPGLPVKLVGFMPERLSDGILNPAIDDVAAMRAIPAMQVFCPADRDELVEALPEILASRAPAYIRYTSAPAAVEHLVPFSIGKAEVLSHEEGVSILTYGPLLHVADRARRALQERGVPVHLVNLRTLEPVDEEAIVDAVRPAELVVTLEDHFRRGGLYTILAETCLEHRLAPRVLGLDSWPLVTDDDVLRHERLSGARVAERILHALCRA